MTSTNKRFSAGALSLAGMGAGVLILGMGSIDLWQSIRCKDWPHTEGVIITAKVESGSRNRYHAAISYEYQVGRIPFFGTRIAIGGPYGSSKEDAGGVVGRYRRGERVPVFYSPRHPEYALLEPGIFGGTWEALCVGAVFVAGCGGLLIASRKTK
jgi:hypothetical protein